MESEVFRYVWQSYDGALTELYCIVLVMREIFFEY